VALLESDRAVTVDRSVSVVIPTRDRPAQTAAAVESALAQTLPPHEIIIVDDSSAEPVNLSYSGVRVLRQPERRGAAAARNRGIDAATGAWVAFLDSDDLWRPDKLERQLGALAADCDRPVVCCCNLLVVNGRDGPNRPHNRKAPSGDLSEWILVDGNTPQTSGIMLPTAAARAIRFDESLRRHQDWDFFLRAAAAGLAISYIAEPLVRYDVSATGDRLSSGANVADSLAWIDGAPGGALVSARARNALLCRQLVAPGMSQRPLAALRALACGVAQGQLRPLPVVRWTARSLRDFAARKLVFD
jgi:glycosyltransferase involved in cell wall biosynthesis